MAAGPHVLLSQLANRDKANKIGHKIKLLRVDKKLKQSEFAKRIGTQQGCISDWERGIVLVSTEFLCKIREEFEISLAYFDV